MGIQSSASDLIATWFGNNGLAHTSQQRTNHHHAASQGGTLLYELVALQIVKVKLICLE